MAEEVTQERVTIFEAINETLKEYYVGISTLPLTENEIASRHKENPPAAIASWQKDHKVWYRCVETGLPAMDSQTFVLCYAEKIAQLGWKVLVD